MTSITRTFEDRFWSRVDRENGPVHPTLGTPCWPWTRTLCEWGYGRVRVPVALGGRLVRAHRVAWELQYGEIPPGMHVLHKCDNPACQRGDHLFLGTNDDNVRDKVAKGRQARGAALKPELRARGERNGSARLTENDVREIRARVAAGERQSDMAQRFGVTSASVWQIVHRVHWAHVE